MRPVSAFQTQVDQKKQALAWAFYDWANSAFATTVMAGFFPLFFKQYWSGGVPAAESTFRLGLANSLGSLVIVLVAPVLGAIADRSGAKKRFLMLFALLGVAMTGGLYLVAQGHWQAAVVLYVLANIGFAGGNIFYDALIVAVAEDEERDVVSALGFALGYLGGGLLFAFNVAMTLWPETFGLADTAQAVRISFLSVALWWAIFSVPVLLFVHEESKPRTVSTGTIRAGLRQLRQTFGQLRRLRMAFWFLLGYWLYIDGVDTIVRMAVDYGLSIGLDTNSLITALLITQFVGFPAAIVFGRLGRRLGAKTGIYIGLAVYIGVTVYAWFMDSAVEFYVLAVVIGLVQGGVQALSRSFYSRLIPPSQSGEFFGFYNMLGKFAAVLGPFLVGGVSLLTGDPRHGILSVLILFLSGAAILYVVDEQEGRRAALALERSEGFSEAERS